MLNVVLSRVVKRALWFPTIKDTFELQLDNLHKSKETVLP